MSTENKTFTHPAAASESVAEFLQFITSERDSPMSMVEFQKQVITKLANLTAANRPAAPAAATERPNATMAKAAEELDEVARDLWNAGRLNPQARIVERIAEALRASLAASAAVPAVPVAKTIRQALYSAAISCGHSIEHEQVILFRDHKKPGNALSQLADRLAAAYESLAATTPSIAAASAAQPGAELPKLPSNDAVYAEVCRQRDNKSLYVSTNAVNDVMAAVRALSASAAQSVAEPVAEVTFSHHSNRIHWLSEDAQRACRDGEKLYRLASLAAPAAPIAAAVPEDVLKALRDARETAMRNTVAARVPECGDFGAIAQNLDWAIDQIAAASTTKEG